MFDLIDPKYYSTVTDYLGNNKSSSKPYYNSNLQNLTLSFTLSIKTKNLTSLHHYNNNQQKLYNEVVHLKEEIGLGYRRISYRLYELGYRTVRTNRVIKNTDVYSIYKKGKIRENRLNGGYDIEVLNPKYYISNI